MGSQFMQQFMAGWQMGQGRNENQRRNQELEMERARQEQMLRQRAEEFELQKEEFAVRKKQLAAEEAATKLKAAHESRKLREEASYLQGMPAPTAAEAGIQQTTPQDVGPTMDQINVPQPTQAIPDPTGGADIQMPILTGRQQEEMALAERQKKMRDALFLKQISQKTPAELEAEEYAKARGRRRGDPRPPTGGHGGGGGIPETIVNDIGRLPSRWQDWNASFPTRDSFSVRNNEQAGAIALANSGGKVLPTKKQADAMLATKATLSDIGQAQSLLNDPEIAKYVGVYQGKMTNFLAKGWADPFGGEAKVPAKVRKFRASLNRLAAEERHRIYGSALTDTESKFAEGFLPALDQSGETIEAALSEFAEDLVRAQNAVWGQGARPGEGGAASVGGDYEPTAVPGVRRRKVQR